MTQSKYLNAGTDWTPNDEATVGDWTPQRIMNWNEECFPLADMKSQVLRVGEELGEFAENGKVSEIADALIAACGIGRFSLAHMVAAIDLITQFPGVDFTQGEVLQAINDKMKINLERQARGAWVFNPESGQYERKEGDEC